MLKKVKHQLEKHFDIHFEHKHHKDSGGSCSPTHSSSPSDDPSSPEHTWDNYDESGGPTIHKSDFTALRCLGKGSFAKVLLVEKNDNGRKYAMKIVDKAAMLAKDRVHDLFSERSVLKRSRHPFIMRLHHTFQSEHQLFFVMDYLPGGDLLALLERTEKKRFTEEQSRFYAAEVFLALQYLHENGVVYRDLKPTNIMLDERGHACLTDMGLAKEFNPDSADMDRRCHSFVGSPAYVAPEILRRKKYGDAVDWWSFGILLHRMLTGTLPFNGENMRKIFEAILHNNLDLEYYYWLSPYAKDLIHALLQKDETQRLTGNAVREHPFFTGVDWDQLMMKSIDPPDYIPPPTLPTDIEQRQPMPISPTVSIASEQQMMFAGFTYTGSLSRSNSIAENIEDPKFSTFRGPNGGGGMYPPLPPTTSMTKPADPDQEGNYPLPSYGGPAWCSAGFYEPTYEVGGNLHQPQNILGGGGGGGSIAGAGSGHRSGTSSVISTSPGMRPLSGNLQPPLPKLSATPTRSPEGSAVGLPLPPYGGPAWCSAGLYEPPCEVAEKLPNKPRKYSTIYF